MAFVRPIGPSEGRRFRLLLLFLAFVLAGCHRISPPAPEGAKAADPAIEKFLDSHWARPLAPQGQAPARLGPLAASLDPESCGSCHVAQFNSWRGSLHSRAMGPGILGQLANMEAGARDDHQGCIRCHAPLAEQADGLAQALVRRRNPGAASPHGGRALFQQGVTCAACHVRGWQWYGPPRRDGSRPPGDNRLPHGAWQASAAFEDSRFCAACHQFTPDQMALNGKLMENTYEEWQASRHAREGKTCQSCHMSDRRHLWRGIHDPDMTRSGVTIRITAPRVSGTDVAASLRIRNTRTGHHFPTYVTPKVVIEGYQEDARGDVLGGTLQQYVIARQVKLDLSEEIADTRLAPDQETVFGYRRTRAPQAKALVLRVRVEPDAFYSDFYRSLLASGSAGKGEAMIRKALADSLTSAYTLLEERQAL